MTTIVAHIEIIGDLPSPDSLKALGAARELIPEAEIVAVAAVAGAPLPLESVPGADELLTLSVGSPSSLWEARAEALRRAIALRRPSALVLAATYEGLELGPRLAAEGGLPVFEGCLEFSIEGDLVRAKGLAFGGRAEGFLEAPAPVVLLLSPAAGRPAVGSPPLRGLSLGLHEPEGEPGVVLTSIVDPPKGEVDLGLSERIIDVGRGAGEDLETIEELAEVLEADIAATRPVVDKGILDRSRQIGKSGLTVSPRWHLALGLSGAPEHVEGIIPGTRILAVNQDPEAPIFELAEVGVVADIGEFAPLLLEKARALKGPR
jgi:electron transfer flavoprotein alpha subunit